MATKILPWFTRLNVFIIPGQIILLNHFSTEALPWSNRHIEKQVALWLKRPEDTEALRQYFVKTYGETDTTYITGYSMEGGITLATIENFSQYHRGALLMCPLVNRLYLQMKVTFDLKAVFSALYPNVLNGSTPSLSPGGHSKSCTSRYGACRPDSQTF